MVSKKKTEEPPADDDSAEDRGKSLFGFKVVHVFDVTQTDGADLPEFATVTGDPGTHLARLEAMVAAHGITIEEDDVPAGALGVSRGGTIGVLPELDIARRFAVLVHEFAHELLHRGERRKETNTTIRETEAEAVAFVVCRAIGLETGTASSDYIQLYQGSKETLAESLNHVQKTASMILEGLCQQG